MRRRRPACLSRQAGIIVTGGRKRRPHKSASRRLALQKPASGAGPPLSRGWVEAPQSGCTVHARFSSCACLAGKPEVDPPPTFLLPADRPVRYIEIPMTTLTTTEIRNFIGGAWRHPTSQGGLELFNPATGEPLGQAPAGSAAEVDAAVQAA